VVKDGYCFFSPFADRFHSQLAVLQVILGAAATTFFIYIFNDRIISSRKCAMACLLWESPEAAFCPYTVNETTMSAYGMVNRTAECGKVVSDKNLGLEPANCLLTFPQYVGKSRQEIL
jgi:hypothetical protein